MGHSPAAHVFRTPTHQQKCEGKPPGIPMLVNFACCSLPTVHLGSVRGWAGYGMQLTPANTRQPPASPIIRVCHCRTFSRRKRASSNAGQDARKKSVLTTGRSGLATFVKPTATTYVYGTWTKPNADKQRRDAVPYNYVRTGLASTLTTRMCEAGEILREGIHLRRRTVARAMYWRSVVRSDCPRYCRSSPLLPFALLGSIASCRLYTHIYQMIRIGEKIKVQTGRERTLAPV